MKERLTPASASLATLLLGSLAVLPPAAKAQDVPSMTIEIHNNSANYSIYPVLSTGGRFPVDTWMQAAFKVPKSQLGDHPYPSPDTFRLYFNPTGAGIPPGSSITVTLPLYTQLVPTELVNPKLPNQYINWWNGGRISLYASPASDGAPPKAPVAAYTNRPSQKYVAPVAGAAVPACPACERASGDFHRHRRRIALERSGSDYGVYPGRHRHE